MELTTPNCPIDGGVSVAWCSKSGFQLYRCTSCDFGFVFPVPQSTDEVYQADYFFGAKEGCGGLHGYVDYDQDKLAMLSTLHKYLETLEQIRGSRGSLLDVGTATGFFVEVASKRGWTAEGIELSQAAVDAGRAKGRSVRQGTLEADVESRRYEVMTFLDVLEHVPDPWATLATARRRLEQGGVIFINVPDAGSVYAKLMGKNWHAIVPPEHLWYFTRRSILLALERAGFVEPQVRKYAKTFRLSYIVSTLVRMPAFRWASGIAERLASSRVGAWKISLPLYDNIVVIAKSPR